MKKKPFAFTVLATFIVYQAGALYTGRLYAAGRAAPMPAATPHIKSRRHGASGTGRPARGVWRPASGRVGG